MNRWVDIVFDCLPLRSVARLDVPMDASPKLAAKILRIKQAFELHGTHNTYFVHNAKCAFHLTNDPSVGVVAFELEGTIFTDSEDLKPVRSELSVRLQAETCDWLNQSVVDWLAESVRVAVLIEFGKYIAAGDLQKTRERLQKIEKALDDQQGFVGMYL